MKKFMFIISLLICLPSAALCPLDPSGNGSCTENIIPPLSPVYKNIETDKAVNNLQPLNSVEPINQMKEPNNRLNDTLNCPFGICSKSIQNPYGLMP